MERKSGWLATTIGAFAIVAAIVTGAPAAGASSLHVGSKSGDGNWVVEVVNPSPTEVNHALTQELDRWRLPSASELTRTASTPQTSSLCQSETMARSGQFKHYVCPAAKVVAPNRKWGEVIAWSQYRPDRVSNPLVTWYRSEPHRDLLWDAGTRTVEFGSVCSDGRLWSTGRLSGVNGQGDVIYRGSEIDIANMEIGLSCSGDTMILWRSVFGDASVGVTGESSSGLDEPLDERCKVVQPNLEFRDRLTGEAEAQLWRLYSAVFERNPDPDGFEYWLGVGRGGHPYAVIADGFMGSSEFHTTYGQLTNAEFVNQIYRNVFCRQPDLDGAAYWVNELNHGMARHQFLSHFVESDEYKRLTGT